MKARVVLRTATSMLFAGALATSLAGCYTMARVPARYITTERPTEIFVRDAEGGVFILDNPTIVQDSLVGQDGDAAVQLNLREVDAMAIRALSKPKTYSAVAGGIGVLSIVTLGIIKATSSNDCPRIANQNNNCLSAVSNCKYGACDEDNTITQPGT